MLKPGGGGESEDEGAIYRGLLKLKIVRAEWKVILAVDSSDFIDGCHLFLSVNRMRIGEVAV